jgi:hypothetical protein
MAIDRNRILDKFNTDQILGKGFGGREQRNPTSISQSISGPYNVNQLIYPLDLTQRADLQHYIVFYINVRGKTKFKPEKVVDVDVSARGQNRIDQQGLTTTAQYGAGIAAAGAAAAGQVIGRGVRGSVRGKAANLLKLATEKGRGVAGVAIAGAVAAGGTQALQNFSDTFSVKEPERTSDAIMLPIETIPSVKYSMKYKDFDFGMLGGILGGSSAIDSSVGGRAAEGVAAAIASIGKLGSGVPGTGDIGATAVQAGKLAAKVATNPFREVLFEAVNFRTFSFSYTFLPKSVSEVLNVRRIIDLFKFHMHPELSKDGLFYVYPSEFEMQYYFKGQENEFLHKISTCVLTDMQVTYGNEYFSSFRDGEPTEIRMALTFREVELMTKERIVKGY